MTLPCWCVFCCRVWCRVWLLQIKKSATVLVQGDSVVVTKGPLKHLQGTVVSVDASAGTFMMKVKAAQAQEFGLTADIEMEIADVIKKFEVRARVCVRWLPAVEAVLGGQCLCLAVAVFVDLPRVLSLVQCGAIRASAGCTRALALDLASSVCICASCVCLCASCVCLCLRASCLCLCVTVCVWCSLSMCSRAPT